VSLSPEEHVKNNLPDVLTRFRSLAPQSGERVGVRGDSPEHSRPRTAQSFCVPKADIAAQGYDLSLNRYKEVVHEEVAHRARNAILAELAKLEEEIQRGMRELEGMIVSGK
jgi:type I restriction enzyme M protein